MTEDYKSNLLKYLTGNLDTESGDNEPQFIDKGTISQNILDYLESNFENGFVIIDRIQQKDIDYVLIYGKYYTNNTHNYENGFIYIITRDLTPISLITEYDSGTQFRPFVSLNIDEDGYIYGIDKDSAKTSKNLRFILLNKVILSGMTNGDFIVKLRNSYFLDSSIQNQVFSFSNGNETTTKKIGSADYFIFVDTKINDDYGIGVISFTINVGATNEWTITKSTQILNTNKMCSLNVYDTQGDLQIIVGGFANNYTYKELTYNFSDTPTITLLHTFPSLETLHSGGSANQTIKLGIDKGYIAYGWVANNVTYTAIYKLDYDNLTYNQIQLFEKNMVLTVGSVGFYNIETELFFRYLWYTQDGDDYICNNYIGLIIDDQVYYVEADTYTEDISGVTGYISIDKIYNLYSIYLSLNDGESQKIQLVYNVNNYNGLPYEAPNCLVPNSAILYNSGNNIIFARNLYNKTVSGQTTTSIVQVPNTLLNDVTIAQNDLLGQTNFILVSDNTGTTKNIYETLNINFANTISIRNDNDINNKVLNPTGATRLNVSTSQLADYNNAKALKVKINYSDNTSSIISLDASQITFSSDTKATYDFDIQVSKAINNIQIISNDTDTIYQTISNLSLEVGKTYNISQDVEVL